MVNLSYVHKRQARRIITAIALGSAALMLVIGAIALLGQKASPFTVKLANSGVSLSLAETEDESASGGKIYLMADSKYDEVPSYCCFTEDLLPKEDVLDDWRSESVFNYNGNKKTATRFFKYTFYVVNNGSAEADYDLELNLNSAFRSVSGRYDLDSVLRVRFFENRDLSKHYSVTYAKSSLESHIDPETNKESWKELISTYKEGNPEEYAEEFLSSKLLLKSHISNLQKGEKVRNTFVFWLEGEDPECIGNEPPVESALVLGVDISAHASQKNS